MAQQTDIQLSLKQRAEFLCQGLLEGDDRLGDRPIVFVAHSLGGLMIKAMLEREWISRGDKSRILSQTKAVVFLGTPHSGSSLANLAETLAQCAISGTGMLGMALATSLGAPMLFPGGSVGNKLAKWILGPSATTESLKDDNPELFDLMKSYRAISRERSIETLSCFETMNYMGVAIVVSLSSDDPGLGDSAAIMGADHTTICKPSSGDSPVYRMVRRVIVRAATKAQRATKRPVFDEQAITILRIMRASRFRMLPRFVWEMDKQKFDTVQTAYGKRYSLLEDLPPNLAWIGNDNWDEKDGKTFRRRVVVEFSRQCEEQIRGGAVKIDGAEEEAAQYSQFDIDKLVLIAWRKYRLEQALLNGDGITRDRIDNLVAKIRTMAEVSLLAGLSSNRRQ